MDAHSARLASLFLMLFVTPLLLVISAFGWKSGWAEGVLKIDAPAQWGPPIGDISVHLGYFNGSVVMTSPYGPEIDLDVTSAQGWGITIICLCFLCLGGGLLVAVNGEKGTKVDMDPRVSCWVVRGGGLVIITLTTTLYLILAKNAHDEVQEKLDSLQVKDKSLWPHPGPFFLSALASGIAMVAASFVVGSSEIKTEYERLA